MAWLKQAIGAQPRSQANFTHGQNWVGAPSFRNWNPGYSMFGAYSSDAYSSAFPSIRAISNEYMTVAPFAIDKNGKPVQNNNIINALYHPNQDDSSVSFREKMAVSTLFHRKSYVLVWRRENGEAKPGGDFGFKGKNIAGFTFLEFPAIERRDGRTYYRIGAQEFNDREVIVLPGGVDPNNLYGGYSPSIASCRWATLDDYIADYQKGFFENGAIPAGMFKVLAPTPKEYNDIVDKLEERHRGAGKNNNVTYAHQPVDPASGKPSEAQITWVPFSQSNKDIDFKNLFQQVNDRIATSYGVSQFIQGVDDAPNYATAQVSDKNFAERAVYPLLLRNWTQFTHELNRITGGVGIAITFKYDIPIVADEEKVEAETNEIRVRTITSLTTAGFTLESIIEALELPTNFKLLKSGSTTETTIENDKPDVDEGDEVDDSPDPSKIDGVTPVNTVKEPDVIEPTKMELTDAEVQTYEEKLAIVIRDHMSEQIEDYISSLDAQDAVGDPTEEQSEDFRDDMMPVILAILLAAGTIQYSEGITMLVEAGVSVDDLSQYVVSEAQEKAYRDYLINVAKSYGDDTGQSIRNVLSRGEIEQWDRNRLEAELRNIMSTDDWRVTRLSVSEVNRSQDMGSIYSMKQIQDEADVKFERSLLHTGADAPCEFCSAFINLWMPLDQNMIDKDQVIAGTEGGEMVYTWDNNEGHDVHANGHCVPQFRVTKSSSQTEARLRKKIKNMKSKLEDLDGRTKEARNLKSELDTVKQELADAENYARQLEEIIDAEA